MIRVIRLTADNYPHHETQIMGSEELFSEDIRETTEAYLDALNRDRVQAFVAFCGHEYAGNVVGFPLCSEQSRILRFDEIDICHEGLIYLFNIVAMPAFSGIGAGKSLLHQFLTSAWKAGFDRAGGHFRGNGSLSNFLKIGGQVLGTFDDWFETGETYSYCEVDLARTVAKCGL